MLKRWRGGARDKRRDGQAGESVGGGVTAGALCEGQTTHGSVFIHWHLCARGAGAARALSRITAISTYYPSCLSAARPCGHAPALGRLNGPLWAERQGQRGDRESGGRRKKTGSGTLWCLQSPRSQQSNSRMQIQCWGARDASGLAVRYSRHGLSCQRELFLEL